MGSTKTYKLEIKNNNHKEGITYLFKVNIFVINIEQVLMPYSSFEAQRVSGGKSINRLD